MGLTPEQVLKKHWGYDNFRLIQKKIIDSAVSGLDTFAVMQTGGGKSICFQIPTMMADGMAVVISPLIALMKDQVDALKSKGITAAYVNAQMDKRSIKNVYIDCEEGRYKFLYVSPERLTSSEFLMSILNCNISYIVIDEAHTISQWGYDFRTSYLNINKFKSCFPKAPLIALTATANGYVKDEVIKTLGLRTGYQLIESTFERDNLNISVLEVENKLSFIAEYLQGKEGQTGIIYSNRRAKCERLYTILNERYGIKTEFYHGGLGEQQRSSRQENWINDRANVMICTNAFGMGIDKDNVRFVIHIDFPESIEGYYQEIGRAGRDGELADAIFLYSSTDIKDHIRQEIKYPEFEQVKDLYYYLNSRFSDLIQKNNSFVLEIDEIAQSIGEDSEKTYRAFKILETHNYISMQSSMSNKGYLTICCDKEASKQLTKNDLDLTVVMYRLFIMMKGKKQKDKRTEIDMSAWRKNCKMDSEKFSNCIDKLNELSVIICTPKKPDYLVTITKKALPQDFNLRMDEVTERKDYQQKQRDSLMSYVNNNRDCRSKSILNYFGEYDSKDCGKCDVCRKKQAK